MRRILLAITALLILASCATYTVKDGYDSIVLPDESGTKLETRYRLISTDSPEEIVFSEPEPATEEDVGKSIPEAGIVEAPEIPESAEPEAAEAEEAAMPASEEESLAVAEAEPMTGSEAAEEKAEGIIEEAGWLKEQGQGQGQGGESGTEDQGIPC